MSERLPLHDITPTARPAPVAGVASSAGKIQTRAFSGRYRRLRLLVGAVLLSLYFATPWLHWGERQAVWWNLPERKFYLFGSTFWPQDFILLSGLLIVAAFSLFFITVYAGRVWCGYSCPQSVWTWLFIWCEQLTEGDRAQRIRLDRSPMGVNKALRRMAKHSLWLALALATALTFVGYFTPIRALASAFFSTTADDWAYIWVTVLTLATYLNAGWLREQICIHLCPYGRFQSVMLDPDSRVVAYDRTRGEPRSSRPAEQAPQERVTGDCVDCTWCVQVCPTGIDIRDGLQLACIGCAACVDACDSVMDKLGRPRGLVGYSSERQLAGQPRRRWRPRLIGYGLVLALMLGLLASAFANRPLAGFDVSRDRMLYRENVSGRVENVYTLKIINKDQQAHRYRLYASGPDDLRLDGTDSVRVAAGEIVTLAVQLSVAATALSAPTHDVLFTLRDEHERVVQAPSRFIGPASR